MDCAVSGRNPAGKSQNSRVKKVEDRHKVCYTPKKAEEKG